MDINEKMTEFFTILTSQSFEDLDLPISIALAPKAGLLDGTVTWDSPFEDCVYVAWVEDADPQACFVNGAVLDAWGISKDKLYEVAKANTHGVAFALGAMLGLPEQAPVLVLTGKGMFYGAGVLSDEGLLREVYSELGKYYLLPSSRHELLAVPADFMGPDEAQAMVRDVNRSVVEAKDFLSDSVYMFDGEHVIRVA